MKRTTIYLDQDTELLLKTEAARSGAAMSDVIREALSSYFSSRTSAAPPGGGAFDSGTSTTSSRAESVLKMSGFGAE
ncbi:MAG TPA: CopG family transcriptional regulator [Thermoanaerobaculia bacterium]|nr:CopG family transcriptional regulator [Thermoanaerobaculia bacterium]